MNYIPVTQARRQRKNKSLVNGDWIVYSMVLLPVLFFIVLLLIFSKSIIITESIVLPVLTMILAISFLAVLSFLVYRTVVACIKGNKRLIKQEKSDRIADDLCGKKLFFVRMQAVLSTLAWGFLLYLLQPFITALLWWQSHQLMVGYVFSITIVNKVFSGIECVVYFGVFACLVQILLLEWSKLSFLKRQM